MCGVDGLQIHIHCNKQFIITISLMYKALLKIIKCTHSLK